MKSVLLTPTNLAALAILLISSSWLGWWFYDRSQFVYVTDARVASTMINVSSRIPGWVADFPLDEGQHVSKGEVLVKVDARDTRLQLSEVEAGIETLRAEHEKKQLELTLAEKQISSAIEAARSNLAAARAGLSEANVGLDKAKKDLTRATSLLQQKMISEETFEDRQAAYDRAVELQHRSAAEVSAARANLVSAEADLARLDVLRKDLDIAERRIREMDVERTRLTNLLDDHVIVSTIDGVVDETFVNPGEYVYPGQRILMLHNPRNVWIKANIKETEIRHLDIGSPVRIAVDAFPDKTWRGQVTNIGTSATSQFAMLPTPNPSGNFTKITQRLEVRVDLEETDERLKPGMMVELRIRQNGS